MPTDIISTNGKITKLDIEVKPIIKWFNFFKPFKGVWHCTLIKNGQETDLKVIVYDARRRAISNNTIDVSAGDELGLIIDTKSKFKVGIIWYLNFIDYTGTHNLIYNKLY